MARLGGLGGPIDQLQTQIAALEAEIAPLRSYSDTLDAYAGNLKKHRFVIENILFDLMIY